MIIWSSLSWDFFRTMVVAALEAGIEETRPGLLEDLDLFEAMYLMGGEL